MQQQSRLNNSSLYYAKRKQNLIFDLQRKQSLGVMSPMEYKRRSIINSIYYMSNDSNLPTDCFDIFSTDLAPLRFRGENRPRNINHILDMEADSKKGMFILAITRYNCILLNYDVLEKYRSQDKVFYGEFLVLGDSIFNSVHWILDGLGFSICTEYSLQYWDMATCSLIEDIKIPSRALNHIVGEQKSTLNKLVAVTGSTGHIFLFDMRTGNTLMTLSTPGRTNPIRAIHWHPMNEFQFASGNDDGDINLLDIRYQKTEVLKFRDQSFSSATSHGQPVVGLRFYNNRNNIISTDITGCIKNWDVSTGYLLPTQYENLSIFEHSEWTSGYNFAVTDCLKTDVAFMPSYDGLRIFDIQTGVQFPKSKVPELPVTCVTYEPYNQCIYGAWQDQMKLWTIRKDDVVE